MPPAPATQPPWLQRARDEPLWAVTLLGAVALCGYAIAAPLLAARYPMLVDLPMHAANASVFRHHHDPAWHFAEQFELRPFAVPYLSFYALAALFMLVLPPLAAVKLAVGVMLALLPAGLALLCWGMRKSPLLGLPALGLLWSNNTHWGFINFVAAMGLFAMVLGLALRLLDRPSRRTAVALGVCLLLLLFSHPFRFPFAVGGVAWATATCYQATRRWRPVVAPCLPALALFALWWWRYPPRDVGSVWSAFAVHGERMAEAPGYLFRNLRGPAEGIAAEDAGLGLLAVFAVLTGFAVPRVRAAWRKWRAEGSGDWLWRAGATAAVMGSTVAVLLGYLSLPMEIGWWWYVYPREIACALFIALALLPDLPPDQRAAPPLFLALCVALVVPQVRAVQSAFTAFDRSTRDFAAVTDELPRAPKLLFLVFDHHGAPALRTPFVHLPGYVQAERGGWLSFQFANLGHSPVAYRPRDAAGVVVPPAVPRRWEWTPQRYRHRQHGHFFDWFLVRKARRPAGLFRGEPQVELVAHQGSWWLYRRR